MSTKMTSDVQEIYERWWLNKFLEDGRQITGIEWIGPPSGVYGIVVLTLSDGTDMRAPQGAYDYRPRKKNLLVFEQNPVSEEC